MTKESTTAAINAVKGLEEKGRKLSEVVAELEEVSSKLSKLDDSIENANKAVASADEELALLSSKTQQIKDELTNELRLRIAENSAEQISRVKDANERLLKLEEKINIHLIELKNLETKITKDSRANRILQLITLLLSASVLAKLFGYI
ncbi:MAG: hypothetical protein ACPGPR_07070 [Paracoccaceae bacterium]|jgi:chromosome segregation ATPase